MAERRMFAKRILEDDRFTDLPFSTQVLYLHLSMGADDDGFINNPKKITRMIGADEEDLARLINKKYLISFDSGIVVIRHWRRHNLIRKDRYTPTKCLEERRSLMIEEDDAYEIRPPHIPVETEWQPNWQPSDNHTDNHTDNRATTKVAPQYSIVKDSLDKNNLDKCSVGKVSIVNDNPDNDFIADATTTATTTQKNNISFSLSAGAGPTQESFQTAPTISDSKEQRSVTMSDIKEQRAATGNRINNTPEKRISADRPEEESKIIPANHYIEGEDTLRQIGGMGQNLVYLSNRQVSNLIAKMGYNVYTIYLERLSNFIIEKNPRIKSHYETILKWYQEDCKRPFPHATPMEDIPTNGLRILDPKKIMDEKIKESLELGRQELMELEAMENDT